MVAENSSKLLSRTNNSQSSTGQGFLFIVIPYSVDMEKEATASQVEYMARRRKKIYLIQILHIYTR